MSGYLTDVCFTTRARDLVHTMYEQSRHNAKSIIPKHEHGWLLPLEKSEGFVLLFQQAGNQTNQEKNGITAFVGFEPLGWDRKAAISILLLVANTWHALHSYIHAWKRI